MRQLFYYPARILEVPSEPVLEFNNELIELIEDMKAIMVKHNGLGLSACQVGVSKRVMIVQNSKKEIFEFINPVVVEVANAENMLEGCLSFPDIFLDIVRPSSVLFQYQDRTGVIKQAMAEGIEARCFLHELDHLNGKTLLNNINREARQKIKSKMKKRRR